MYKEPWEYFWWNNITGARAVVERVSDELLADNIVILQVPSDLPWRHSLRNAIKAVFRDKVSSQDIIIDFRDMADENPDGIEPGKFILARYDVRGEIRDGYRECSGVKIQDYIRQNGVIKDRVLWIKGLDRQAEKKWIKFCRDYTPQGGAMGLIVLEIHGACDYAGSRNLKLVNYSDFVSSYDVQLFNRFVLDSAYGQYSEVWQSYISTVAAQVCGTDAEVSEYFIRNTDIRNEDIFDSLQRISENPDFAKRGRESEGRHVLWEVRNNRRRDIERRLWAAQVQVLFPIIEIERVKIVEAYKSCIQEALASYHIEQYGSPVTNVADVEWGTLVFMMGQKNQDGTRMLYVPDEGVRDRICFLRECRNALAHAECCSLGQVKKLIDGGNISLP